MSHLIYSNWALMGEERCRVSLATLPQTRTLTYAVIHAQTHTDMHTETYTLTHTETHRHAHTDTQTHRHSRHSYTDTHSCIHMRTNAHAHCLGRCTCTLPGSLHCCVPFSVSWTVSSVWVYVPCAAHTPHETHRTQHLALTGL